MQLPKPRSWTRLCALLLLCLCAMPSAHAQIGDLPPMQWYSANDPVTIGQGVDISVAGIGTRNAPFIISDANLDKHQPTSRFESHDFSRTENILSSLKVNVWASVRSLTYGGSLSFNYSKLTSSNVDERKWEVSALRTQTWALKSEPTLTTLAKPYATPANQAVFRNLYGNYFVSAITYRRRLRVRFTSQVSKQVNEQDIRAAIGFSSKVFSASADLESLQHSLENIGSVSVEIEIDGLEGSEVFGFGTLGTPAQRAEELDRLRDRVSALLERFGDQSLNGPPGVIDTVKLRHYSTAIPVNFDPFKTPKEDSLGLALASYLRLEGVRNRLEALRGRNYNSRLKGYLLSKSQEVETKRQTLVRYMQRLILNQDEREIPRPNTDVAFDDPDVIRWRFVGRVLRGDLMDFIFETYGEFDAIPTGISSGGQGGPAYFLVQATSNYDIQGNPFDKRDPITGIRRRMFRLEIWYNGADGIANPNVPSNARPTLKFELRTQEAQQHLLATDPTNIRQLQILIPPSIWRF